MASMNLVHETFRYNLIIMKIFGIYPFDSWPKLYKPYAFITYIVFTSIPPVLSLIQLIVTKEKDLEVITHDGTKVIELLSLIFKILPCKINPEGTRRTVYALNRDIFNSHLPEQQPILSDIVKNCRLIFTIISIDYLAAVTGWTSEPLWYEDRRFPFAIWLPFDPTTNAAIYWSIYIYIVVGVMYGGSHNQALDTLMSNLIYHAAGQLRILKDSLEHLGERAEQEVSMKIMSRAEKDKLKSKIIYKKICDCIEHYEAISEFVDDIEKTYSPVIFSQFVASIIVTGICIYHLSVAELFTAPFLVTIVFTTAVLGEIFLQCYSGSLLFEESNSIGQAIYMSEWYTFDEKCKKALIILMERAKRPMIITAGKVMDLSLGTFATIMRRSYSILALLKNS